MSSWLCCAGTDGSPAWLLWKLHLRRCLDSQALISWLHLANLSYSLAFISLTVHSGRWAGTPLESLECPKLWRSHASPGKADWERWTRNTLRIQARLRSGNLCDLQGWAPKGRTSAFDLSPSPFLFCLRSFCGTASNKKEISGLTGSGRKLWAAGEDDGSKQHPQGLHCVQGTELSWR